MYDKLLICVIICIVCSCCILLIQCYKLICTNQQAKRNRNIEMQIRQNETKYAIAVHQHRKYGKVKHDIVKCKRVIGGYVKNNDGSNKSLLVSLIQEKQKVAQDKDIIFRLEMESHISTMVDMLNMVRLMENILDNAIEACENVGSGTYIKLIIKNVDDKLHIWLENSKDKDCHPIETGMVTTKEDIDSHGYGMDIVRTIVEQYGGSIDLQDKDDRFQVYICI